MHILGYERPKQTERKNAIGRKMYIAIIHVLDDN